MDIIHNHKWKYTRNKWNYNGINGTRVKRHCAVDEKCFT